MAASFAARLLLTSVLLLHQVGGEETCPLESTPSDALGPFYLPVEETDQLAPADQLSDPNNVLKVEGTMFGNDCVPLSNMRVEAWYAGEPDEQGNAYSVQGSDLNYRGNVVTDECGKYNFTQSFPILYTSRPIHHIHFRLSIADTNEELLVTQMYFEGLIPSGWRAIDDSQVVPISVATDGVRSVVFDIHIGSMAGTADAQVCGISNQTVSTDTNTTDSGTAIGDGTNETGDETITTTSGAHDVLLPFFFMAALAVTVPLSLLVL